MDNRFCVDSLYTERLQEVDMMNTPISFRLRKDLDADLINVVETMDKKLVNRMCRDGLRIMLGIRTTRITAVHEQPLSIPVLEVMKKDQIKTLQGKPAVYVPKRKG